MDVELLSRRRYGNGDMQDGECPESVEASCRVHPHDECRQPQVIGIDSHGPIRANSEVYFDRRDTAQFQRRLIGQLEALGLHVTVAPLPQAA